jgi:hypothetical protein
MLKPHKLEKSNPSIVLAIKHHTLSMQSRTHHRKGICMRVGYFFSFERAMLCRGLNGDVVVKLCRAKRRTRGASEKKKV